MHKNNLQDIDDNHTSHDTVVRIDKSQFSLYELKRRYEVTGRILLNPDFQRGDAWKTDRQKSELIESVLMGIPIPLFYFFETKYGELEVVDGRQRTITFIDFMNDKFPLTYLSNFSSLNTLYFKDLEPRLQAKIEDYQITAYIIQPPTPEKIKFDIFERINRGGTQLNHQEIRNALHQGSVTKLLTKLSQLEIFKLATDNLLTPNRMEDKEWILRFLYIYLLKIENFRFDYPYDLQECLTDTMKYFNKEEDLIFLESTFEKVITMSYELFEKDGFKFNDKRELNIHLFETLCYLYIIIDNNRNMQDLKITIDDLKDNFENMDEFSSSEVKENMFRFNMIEDLRENNDN